MNPSRSSQELSDIDLSQSIGSYKTRGAMWSTRSTSNDSRYATLRRRIMMQKNIDVVMQIQWLALDNGDLIS